MPLLNLRLLCLPPTSLPQFSPRSIPFFLPELSRNSLGLNCSSSSSSLSLFPISLSKFQPRVSISGAGKHAYKEEEEEVGDGGGILMEYEDLGVEGEVFRKTLRLVECAMLASVSGLAYVLSNSLAIENYFGCFFSLPIVISSIRWGIAAGRKTMLATAMLLLTLSGPVKASTYLLMHGVVGLAMGSLWRLRINWGVSIVLCTVIRAMGATGYILLSSFLMRENILDLITINLHASLTYILMDMGVNTIPSIDAIYAIFGSLLLLNCGFFVFLLHVLYAVFLTKLGMRASLTLPRWLEKAT
ncbi:uncharacterized protein [Elaeis guineensis]|uniref:Uncharacterized protein LOC105060276 isoform X1 n=1 Tax=Elaeis guineensis var. tenera TaxID=51953 RepID=A0A6I9SEX7_ELAGV|nr:uncharacterized protein LOC105060276 isoform X1 [Elaeis guineensis]